MEALKEIMKSLFDSTEERLSSPLIGSFLISWFIFNWDPVLYFIFASNAIDNKIFYIHSNIGYFSGVILPATTSAAYCFLYPYASYTIKRHIDTFLQKHKLDKIKEKKESALISNQLFEINSKYEIEKQTISANVDYEKMVTATKAAINNQLEHHKLEKKKDLINEIYEMKKKKALNDVYPEEELERLVKEL